MLTEATNENSNLVANVHLPELPSQESSEDESSSKANSGVDIIKTKPQIIINKKFNGLVEKLYVPPSTCSMTLNERFTQLNCRIMRHTIDPGHEDNVYSNTLFGRLKRKAATAPYAPAHNRATYLAAMRLKKRSIHHLHLFTNLGELGDGRPVDIYAKYKAMRSYRRYYTGPPKTKDELDEEIDEYMAKRGKVNLDDDENEDNNPQPPRDDYKNPNYFKQVMAEIKYMSKEEAKAKLDEDLDSYFGLSKKKLDEDLDNYRKQGAKEESEPISVDDELNSYFAVSSEKLDEELENYHKQGSSTSNNPEPIIVDDDFDL